MHFSSEGAIGIALGLVALFGTGAIMIFPTRLWIGWGLIAISAIGFALLAAIMLDFWEMRIIPKIGMIFSTLFLIGFAAWYFWPSQPPELTATLDDNPQTASTIIPTEDFPPIGSLRYVIATLAMDISNSTHLMSGRIEVEIHNDTDRTIYYDAITAGNINGVPFDVNKVEFNGYVYPRQSSFLLSKRLVGLRFKSNTKPDEPPLRGIYEYDLKYRYADAKAVMRHSARGIQLDDFNPPGPHPVGASLVKPMIVTLYNQIEE